MADPVHVTVLVDDTAQGGLLAEHGLSFWIETPEGNVLFDTGQGGAILQNACMLSVELARCDAIVLSHGHYDHTGGLDAVLRIAKHPPVYVHPLALEPKYIREANGAPRYIGMPEVCSHALLAETGTMRKCTQVTPILKGVYATGPIPRVTDFEDTGGPFFIDKDCASPDPLTDDLAVFLDLPGGLVVLLGCAHSGVINTLDYVKILSGGKRICCVIGGMHLLSASDERIRRTRQSLQDLKVQKIGLAHCTGKTAAARLRTDFDSCFLCSAGTICRLDMGK